MCYVKFKSQPWFHWIIGCTYRTDNNKRTLLLSVVYHWGTNVCKYVKERKKKPKTPRTKKLTFREIWIWHSQFGKLIQFPKNSSLGSIYGYKIVTCICLTNRIKTTIFLQNILGSIEVYKKIIFSCRDFHLNLTLVVRKNLIYLIYIVQKITNIHFCVHFMSLIPYCVHFIAFLQCCVHFIILLLYCFSNVLLQRIP